MGVQKTEFEISSSVPAEKIFKGVSYEIDTILPKAVPGIFKNFEVKGDGGPGTLKYITFPDESPIKTTTVRVDGLNKETLTFDYCFIEGDILLGFIESIAIHLTVVPTADGGSITKITTIYNTKGDAVVPEEIFKFDDAQNTKMFKGIEAYLLAN